MTVLFLWAQGLYDGDTHGQVQIGKVQGVFIAKGAFSSR